MSVTIFSQNQKKEDNKSKKPQAQKLDTQPQEPRVENKILKKNEGEQVVDSKDDSELLKLQEENIDKASQELPKSIKSKRRQESLLSSYLIKPKKVAYNAQLKEESIVLLLRQHPITQFGKVLIIIIGLFFPILLISSKWLEMIQIQYQAGIMLGWYLILFGFAMETFLSWYFRVFIVTNRRVIDVDFHSMVHKDITTAKLENIQDVNFITAGVLASLIDYGTVYLQTAGATAKTEFEKVPHPSEVTKIVNEMIAQKKRAMGRSYLKKSI